MDCMPESSSDHPSKASGRYDDSANGDASRLTHCAVVPTASAPGAPGVTSRCVECLSDCDCNEGQYCSVDQPTCVYVHARGALRRHTRAGGY